MPIFYQQDIDECTKLAVWKITETEEFFLSEVPLQRAITHPQKRLQHLAGRYLLKYLFADFPLSLIRIADTRKPFLHDEVYHFSISHCGDFAAAIVSKNKRVGVDVELITPTVQRIEHKFLNSPERIDAASPTDVRATGKLQKLTVMWSCKEAVYKWWSFGGVDFAAHIQLSPFQLQQDGRLPVRFVKTKDISLELHYRLFNGFCLAWVAS